MRERERERGKERTNPAHDTVSISLLKITNGYRSHVYGVFILYNLSTFLLDLRYRTWKDGESF